MKKANYLVLDCETGGLKPENNPITQVAFIVINDNLKEIDRYETFISPYDNLKIEQAALDATGLKIADINNGLKKEVAQKQISDFIMKHQPTSHPSTKPIVVGHNVQFDIGFLKRLFNGYKYEFSDLVSPTSIDTQVLTKMRNPLRAKLNLASCCEDIGVKLDDAHKAMNDTYATSLMFINLIRAIRNTEIKIVTEQSTKSKRNFQF